MGLIGWHLVRRILLATLVVHVFIAGLVVWTQVLSQTMPILDAQAGPLMALALILPILPGVSVLVLPMAFAVALLHVLLTLQADGEATALLAAGGSPVRLVLPGMVAGLVVALITATTSLWVEPLANQTARQMIGQLQSSAMRLLSGQTGLQRLADGLYLQHGPLGPDGRLDGVFVLDRRAPQAETVYTARSGQLDDVGGAMQLRLTDGEMRVRNTATTPPRGGQGIADYDVSFHDFLIAPTFFTGKLPAPQSVRLASTATLLAVLHAEPGGPLSPEAARAELARRLSDWLYPFAFAALAGWIVLRGTASLAARERRRRGALMVGVALAGLIRLAGIVALTFAGQSPLWALAPAAVPLTATLLCLTGATLSLRPDPRHPAKAAPHVGGA